MKRAQWCGTSTKNAISFQFESRSHYKDIDSEIGNLSFHFRRTTEYWEEEYEYANWRARLNKHSRSCTGIELEKNVSAKEKMTAYYPVHERRDARTRLAASLRSRDRSEKTKIKLWRCRSTRVGAIMRKMRKILLSAADFPISYNVALCGEEEASKERQALHE